MKLAGVFFALCSRRFLLASLLVAQSAVAATDNEIIADFKKESARIQAAMAAVDADPERFYVLQGELKALVGRTVERVSEKSRPAFRIGVEIINPLVEESMRYTKLVQTQIAAGLFDYTTATTTEIIEERFKSLAELDARNTDLAKRLAGLDAEIEKTLNGSTLGARDRAEFLEGFRQSTGRRFAAQKAVRTLDTALYVEIRSIYTLLKDQSGKWSAKDGQIVFQEDAHVTTYNNHLARISELAARQEKAMQTALGVASQAPAANP